MSEGLKTIIQQENQIYFNTVPKFQITTKINVHLVRILQHIVARMGANTKYCVVSKPIVQVAHCAFHYSNHR